MGCRIALLNELHDCARPYQGVFGFHSVCEEFGWVMGGFGLCTNYDTRIHWIEDTQGMNSMKGRGHCMVLSWV